MAPSPSGTVIPPSLSACLSRSLVPLNRPCDPRYALLGICDMIEYQGVGLNLPCNSGRLAGDFGMFGHARLKVRSSFLMAKSERSKHAKNLSMFCLGDVYAW